METLRDLYPEHQGKVSDKWSLYLDEYERIFSPYRDLPIRLLEIGIQNGGSLEIWGKYFRSAVAFVGCDINPNCGALEYEDPRISVVVGDANSELARAEILKKSDCFDLIIDDGSHTSSDIVKAFSLYFPVLADGGVFVVEDLHCSYWKEFEGGLYDPYSSLAFFRRLSDVLSQEHWGISKSSSAFLSGFSEHYSAEFDDAWLTHIHSVEFINSMCIIRKCAADKNRLGRRVVTGCVSQVSNDPLEVKSTFSNAPSQSENVWAVHPLAPEEECVSLLHKLNECEVRNAELIERNAELIERNAELIESGVMLKSMLASRSWRITQPLRLVRPILSKCVRYFWRSLPLNQGTRHRIKSFLFTRFSWVFRGTWAYMGWLALMDASSEPVNTDTPCRSQAEAYHRWIESIEKPSLPTVLDLSDLIERMPLKPIISIVTPVYNTDERFLRECIESVIGQSYPYWELCIADDASPKPYVQTLLKDYASKDTRIKVVYRRQNGHISLASNSALEVATGEYIALLDHDDVLPRDALYFMAEAINVHPDAQILYSDEDKIDAIGVRFDPHFKSDWNPDLFFSQNYVSHLGVYRRALVARIGGFRIGVEGSQDYDLLMRCLPYVQSVQVIHIPRILYHWRAIDGSTAQTAESKSYTTERGIKALQDYFNEAGPKGVVIEAGKVANTYRVHWPIPNPAPLVSLLIPTRDRKDIIEVAVRSILDKTTYPSYEIIILDNGSVESKTLDWFGSIQREDPRVKVIRYDCPFNYSAINNFGVQNSKGDLVGLINNDIEVISPHWLSEMVSHACRKDIGCVGAKLYYGNDLIQHAGVITGIGGVAGHSHKLYPRESFGYFNRLCLIQNLSAVTAACLIVRKEIFEAVGGLDEEHLTVAFNDVDFCLRVREAGYRNIWTPYAELYHHESLSRGAEDTHDKRARFKSEIEYMQYTWGCLLKTDPFYSIHLTRDREDFSLDCR